VCGGCINRISLNCPIFFLPWVAPQKKHRQSTHTAKHPLALRTASTRAPWPAYTRTRRYNAGPQRQRLLPSTPPDMSGAKELWHFAQSRTGCRPLAAHPERTWSAASQCNWIELARRGLRCGVGRGTRECVSARRYVQEYLHGRPG